MLRCLRSVAPAGASGMPAASLVREWAWEPLVQVRTPSEAGNAPRIAAVGWILRAVWPAESEEDHEIQIHGLETLGAGLGSPAGAETDLFVRGQLRR